MDTMNPNPIEYDSGATINLAKGTHHSRAPCQKFWLGLAGSAEPLSYYLPGSLRRNWQDMEAKAM